MGKLKETVDELKAKGAWGAKKKALGLLSRARRAVEKFLDDPATAEAIALGVKSFLEHQETEARRQEEQRRRSEQDEEDERIRRETEDRLRESGWFGHDYSRRRDD